jgi:preprotein translocase subunit SecA
MPPSCTTASRAVVRSLKRDVDYEVEEDKRVVVPLEPGIEKVEKALGIENLYDEVQQNLVHQLSVALKAKELYKRDKDYIVANGEVKIVDEFTGRVLEGRRWSEGIHQAVEAKEGVKIKEENQTLATVTLQNYFRMYDKLAGMTGTAADRGRRVDEHLRLQVVPIPTNKPMMPHRPGRPDLQERGRQVRRRGRRHRRQVRAWPAGARRHDQRREERAPVAHARQARDRPRGAQRQAARA